MCSRREQIDRHRPRHYAREVIHQLRTYEIFDHNKAAFHQRFEEHAWRIMKTYGFEVAAFWEAQEEGRPVFVYLLSWLDEHARESAWGAFMADQEWKDIKERTRAEHGRLVGWIRDQTLIPTTYSPGQVG